MITEPRRSVASQLAWGMQSRASAVLSQLLKERLATSLWVAPALGVLVALVIGIVLVLLDHAIAWSLPAWLAFQGGPVAAREMLSTITSAMLTFIALVFTITVLVLQLASNQFSPRVIRTFLLEPATKLAMFVFVGTFVYAILVLSRIRNGELMLSLATWFAIVMVIVAIGVFIRYIHTMAHAIRAITIITKIANETHRSIDRMYPDEAADPAPPDRAPPRRGPDRVILHEGRGAILAFIDDPEAVLSYARECDAIIEIVPAIGCFVTTGGELFRIWGTGVDDARLREAVHFETERVPDQDPAFGFRQLVDIAVRALSPGINDPTTAVQALDHVHDLLRRLTLRDIPDRLRVDESGAVRLIANRPDYADYVRLAFDEIRHYGASSIQVTQRVRTALEDCYAIAPASRRRVLAEQLGLVDRSLMKSAAA